MWRRKLSLDFSPPAGQDSPGDVVVVYPIATQVPVALKPVETVEGLLVVVWQWLVQPTVQPVLYDEHSEGRGSITKMTIQVLASPEVGTGNLQGA